MQPSDPLGYLGLNAFLLVIWLHNDINLFAPQWGGTEFLIVFVLYGDWVMNVQLSPDDLVEKVVFM